MNREEKPKIKNLWFKNASLTTLGWELALPIFIGVFLGYHIDRLFQTRYIFTIVFLFGGIGAGYYSLIKYIELDILRNKLREKQSNKEDKKK